MFVLDNRVQPYAWGSTHAIPGLLGTEPDGGPQAELWIGAHPSAPSLAAPAGGGAPRPLDEVVAADPAGVLGPQRRRDRLGFLLKVLSAAAPLSLQAHPDRATAQRRYAEEEAAGVAHDAPHRLYRDDEHKPELLYALEPFAAVAGFRSPAAARELLTGLDLPPLPPAADHLLTGLLQDLAGADESVALRAATTRLLDAAEDAAAPLAGAVATACRDVDDDSARCVVLLAEHHPGDPGVLVSTLLNQVRLAAGEALYLPAGNVHAYLSGTGVELMASSDNVLRGGLTPKHVDVPELLRVLDFRVLPPPLLPPRRVSDDEVLFAPGDVDDFALSVLQVRPGARTRWERAVPRALLCLDGEVRVESATSGVVLARGRSAFATAAEHPLMITGSGRLVAAGPGGA
ncbi:mannose-6-phosphate isomerase, class I [Kineococcus auxinigenes]|uniref:mannose-6-phosphate isomerase, class I n=1 Tax=unclassified Kineococcus TaxID=2621656 RepID=UPI003D7E61F8